MIMPTILNPEALKKQKQIFEDTLVREILAEIQLMWDVSSERAENRKTYGQKVFGIISKALVSILDLATAGSGVATAIVPPIVVVTAGLAAAKSVTDLAVTGVEKVIDAKSEKGQEKTSELLSSAAGDFLESALRQFARVAALRYEYLIAVRLTENPAGSVIPLARIGARRVVKYLQAQVEENINFKDKSFEEIQALDLQKQNASPNNNNNNNNNNNVTFPIIDFLLDGLIQGHSGKYVDRLFTNNYLLAKDSKEKLTVEGALGRPAMRELPSLSNNLVTQDWPIYYRKDPWHKGQGKDKRYTWGKTKFNKKDDPTSGPKYGYIFVNARTRQQYQYTNRFNENVKNSLHVYYPTVYQASKDEIINYLKTMRTLKSENKSMVSFLSYLQNEKNRTRIDSVWVRGVDFRGVEFEIGDFSEIDFAGCCFDGVKVGAINFARANLAFVSAEGWQCEGTNFNKVDFSFANLAGSSFKGVHYIDATWIGTNLDKIEDSLLEEVNVIKAKQDKQTASIREIRKKLTELCKDIKKIETEVVNQSKQLTEQKTTLNEQELLLKEQAERMEQLSFNAEALKKHFEFKIEEINARIGLLEGDQGKFKEEYHQEINALESRYKEVMAKLEIQAKAIEEFELEIKKGNNYAMDVSLFEDAQVSPGFKSVVKDFVNEVANIPSDLYTESSPEEKLKFADKILNFAKETKNAIRFKVGQGLKGGLESDISGVRNIVVRVGDSQKNNENNNNNASNTSSLEPSKKVVVSSLPMTETQYQLLQNTKKIFNESKQYPKDSSRPKVIDYRKLIEEKLKRLEEEDNQLSTEDESWLLQVMAENSDSKLVAQESSASPVASAIPSMKDVIDSTLFAPKQSSLPPVSNTPEGSKSLSSGPPKPGG